MPKRFSIIAALSVFLIFGIHTHSQDTACLPAFPGAEGFGACTPGGREGVVIAVTNLEDSGKGSLRHALETRKTRVIVFHVSGTINLKSDLVISHPYITVAGQTAPGDGITLRGAGLRVDTHDVIIRYLRIRPGPDVDDPGNGDALFIARNAHQVIIDHVSLSWATDENLSIYGQDITIQNSIISEGLAHAGHPEGDHSKGAFWAYYANRISFLRNLLAHNRDRNPYSKLGDAEIVNNVIYNPGWVSTQLISRDGPIRVNYIGNFIKGGANTRGDAGTYLRISPAEHAVSVYTFGNLGPGRRDQKQPENDIIRPAEREFYTDTSFQFPTRITKMLGWEAYEYVLENAGAILPRQDSIDARIVAEVKSGDNFLGTLGRIIDHPDDVGGWPELISQPYPEDTDGDGIPDEFEAQHNRLNPNDASDARQVNNDGYTFLELYLNSLTPDKS